MNKKSYFDKAIARSENSNNTGARPTSYTLSEPVGEGDVSYFVKSTSKSSNSNDTDARPKPMRESDPGPETPNRIPTGGAGNDSLGPMRSRTIPAPLGRSGRGVPKE